MTNEFYRWLEDFLAHGKSVGFFGDNSFIDYVNNELALGSFIRADFSTFFPYYENSITCEEAFEEFVQELESATSVLAEGD